MSIIGLHAIVYSKQHETVRAFFRDTLKLPSVDAGRGWLIFEAPPAEIAVHPSEGGAEHELYLMCDDLEATIAELNAKGVAAGPIQEQPWGRLTQLTLPSGDEFGMYQPKHPMAIKGGRAS